MPIRTLDISVIAAMFVCAPALASAQVAAYGTSSPVAITSVNVHESFEAGVAGGDVWEAPQFVPNGVTIKFENKSAVPATAVTFLLTDGRSARSIVDKGSFSPGVRIDHAFSVAYDFNQMSNPILTVAAVDFVDGTSWKIPARSIEKAQATTAPAASPRVTSPASAMAPLNGDADVRRVEFRNLGTSLERPSAATCSASAQRAGVAPLESAATARRGSLRKAEPKSARRDPRPIV